MNATEEAVYRALTGLRKAVTDWSDLLAADDPDPVAIEQMGGDIRSRARQVVRSCSRLSRSSPFRYDPVAEGLYLALATLEAARAYGSVALEAIDIEDDVCDLQEFAAGLSLARAIARIRSDAGLTVRSMAARVGISPGYWSELEGAKAGLPSDDVLRRIEAVAGEDLRHLTQHAGVAVKNLRIKGRERRARRDRRSEPDRRLDTVITKLARDNDLLELVDKLLTLKPETRRAIAIIITDAAK